MLKREKAIQTLIWVIDIEKFKIGAPACAFNSSGEQISPASWPGYNVRGNRKS